MPTGSIGNPGVSFASQRSKTGPFQAAQSGRGARSSWGLSGKPLRCASMRYVALDLGEKRTGVAVGDSITGLVTPVDVLEVPARQQEGAALLEAIARTVEEHLGPASSGRIVSKGELVIGLPVNMDGTEGPRAKAVRELAAKVAAKTGREVRFQDERLSSAAADWAMARSGLTHKQKKERRDALAAAAILSDFLASLKGPAGEEAP